MAGSVKYITRIQNAGCVQSERMVSPMVTCALPRPALPSADGASLSASINTTA